MPRRPGRGYYKGNQQQERDETPVKVFNQIHGRVVHNNHRQVQISTRGAGIAAVSSLMFANSLFRPPPITEYPLLPLYRVTLALIEEKMAYASGYHTNTHARTFLHSSMSHMVVGCPLPKMIIDLVNILGRFDRGGLRYFPVAPKDRRTDAGRFIPDSGRVFISNLRETVVAMSDPSTDLELRVRFEEENPLPGAVYQNHLLMNPDDIMPASPYDHNGLNIDIHSIYEYFSSMVYYNREHFVGPSIHDLASGKGSPACSVTTKRVVSITPGADLEQLARTGINYRSHGYRTYYSPIELTDLEWAKGIVAHLREPPNVDAERYPFWDGCYEDYAPYTVDNVCANHCLDALYTKCGPVPDSFSESD